MDNCRAISRGIVCNRIRGPKETQYSRLSIFSLHLLLFSTLVKCRNPLFNYKIWEEWCRGVPQSQIIVVAVLCSVLSLEMTDGDVTASFSFLWGWGERKSTSTSDCFFPPSENFFLGQATERWALPLQCQCISHLSEKINVSYWLSISKQLGRVGKDFCFSFRIKTPFLIHKINFHAHTSGRTWPKEFPRLD